MAGDGMREFRLPDAVAGRLREAGWTPGRDIDPRPYTAVLVDNGLTVHPAAADILRRFGGLELLLPYRRGLIFDPAESVMWLTPADVPYLSELTGEPLCPVGYANQMHVLAAPDGAVVYLNDEWMAMWRWPDLGTALGHVLFPSQAWIGAREVPAPKKCPPGYRPD